MFSKRVILVANISLVIVALFLTLNLFDVKIPNIGRVLDLLDKEEPSCLVQWENEINPLPDMGRCCLGARAQLGCHQENSNWVCETGPGTLRYILNKKAYNYCLGQVIWNG